MKYFVISFMLLIGLQISAQNKTVTMNLRSAATPPAGSSGYIQFNSSGAFGASSNLFWDNTNSRLGLSTTTPATNLDILLPATGNTNEGGVRISRTNGTMGFFRMGNSTTNTTGNFLPSIAGRPNYNGAFFTVRGVQFQAGQAVEALRLQAANSAESGTIASADKAVSFYNWSTEIGTFLGSGNFGLGVSAPTSVLHLKAGTSTAGTAPLGFTAGTVLTTAVSGKMETNSTNNLFYTDGSAVRGAVQINKTTGTAANSGIATLVAGTVTVNTTAALTASNIQLTVKTAGGVQGFLSYTIVNATSFTINSTSAAETSSVGWNILN